MTLAGKAAAVFGYRALPTALLTLITYLAILVAIRVTDVLPAVPSPEKQGGLSLEEAYEDLMHITANPHPYNSHANDHVRAYLLARLTALADTYPHVHVVDDRTTNLTYVSTDLARGYSGHGVYFEGTNLLVKVDGTGMNSSDNSGNNDGSGAVLFSAHYDSVSTARGATDDGMGVATLLQLVHYFAAERTPRTAVFNINNGEEDGLHGAHAFMSHPWSNLTSTFLNLEGAAAGGPPVLFRATSTAPVRALSKARNQGLWGHPHANVLSADAFARGVIRSGTDYSVYAASRGASGGGKEEEEEEEGDGNNGKGMAGLDLAFYKGRSRYHTAYDAVPYTVGGRRSLWAMMEAGRGIGVGLLGAPPEGVREEGEDGEDGAVYFDLFKSTIVIFRLRALLSFNILALLVGPAALALLLLCGRFPLCGRFLGRSVDGADDDGDDTRPLLRDDLSTRRRSVTPIPGFHAGDEDEEGEVHQGRRGKVDEVGEDSRAAVVWRHAAFWVALCASVGVLGLLGWGYVVVNPFAVYASSYVVLASFASAVYLTLITVLSLPFSLPFTRPKPPTRRHRTSTRLLTHAQLHKQTVFLHLYAFTWALLLAGTLGITHVRPGLGGGYLLSAWNACVWAGCVLGAVEGLFARVGRREEEREDGEADERTPLIRGGHDGRATRKDEDEEEKEGLVTAWWLAQFAVSVPVPLILFGQVAALLLDAVPQTMADGGAPSLVYALIALPALLLVLPLAPFARKLRRSRALTLLVLLVFGGTTVYAVLKFPFVEGAELKVFFQQSVAFPRQNTTTGGVHGLELDTFGVAPTVTTLLTGAKKYLRTHLIPRLPSARGQRVSCMDAVGRPSLATCTWDSSGLLPVPGSSSSSSQSHSSLAPLDVRRFFEAQVKATGPRSAFVSVKGRNTRACRVYFDSMPVESYTVRHLDSSSSVAPLSPVSWSAAAGRTWGEEDEEDVDAQAPFVKRRASAASGEAGVREVRLWSRTWDLALGVAFSWAPSAGNDTFTAAKSNSTTVMEGRIACEWAEYESGMVDTGAVLGARGDDSMAVGAGRNASAKGVPGSGAKIPAFEEVLAYLPEWAAVSKASDGLVEAWMPFVV